MPKVKVDLKLHQISSMFPEARLIPYLPRKKKKALKKKISETIVFILDRVSREELLYHEISDKKTK